MRHIHNIIYRMQSAIQHVKTTPAFKLQHPEQVMPRFIIHVQPDHYPGSLFQPLELKVTQSQLTTFLASWIVLPLDHMRICSHD